MIRKHSALTGLFGVLLAFGVQAASINGVPMKDYHVKAFGNSMQCKMCHNTEVPTARPDDKNCIACHGPMSKIETPKNNFDKKPHQSAHFQDTLECTACHAEHKPSKDLCSTCHKVEWQSFQ